MKAPRTLYVIVDTCCGTPSGELHTNAARLKPWLVYANRTVRSDGRIHEHRIVRYVLAPEHVSGGARPRRRGVNPREGL